MPNYAVIENNIITNVVDIDDPNSIEGMITENGWIPLPIGFGIGDKYIGNEFEKVQQIIPVPLEVTMRQARLALLENGLLDSIKSTIESISDPIQRQRADIEWEYSPTVNRNNELVKTIELSLNLTSDQVDQLFIKASKL